MSATMDLSPLKVETSSTHSSPHRTPLRSSPLGSPSGSDMDIALAYSTVGFTLNSDIGGRAGYTKVAFEGSIYKHNSRLPNSSQVSGFLAEKPTSAPVIASFMTNEDSESCQGKTVVPPGSSSPAPKELPSLRVCQQQPHTQAQCVSEDLRSTKQVPNDDEDIIVSTSDKTGALRQHVDEISTLDHEEIEHEDTSSLSEKAPKDEALDDDNDDNDKVMSGSIHDDDDAGDDASDKDDDQIECAECNKVFCNLQIYMDHTCYKSQIASRALTNKANTISSPFINDFQSEGSGSDVEHFQGKLIFNHNGSAYVLEGHAHDHYSDIDFSLLHDFIVISEGESVLTTGPFIPQIHSITLIPKNDSSSAFRHASSNVHQLLPGRSRTPIHKYHVFDIGTPDASGVLHKYPTHAVHRSSAGPVLMCIICKLVFKKSKPFLHHVIYYHSVDLSDNENSLLSQNMFSIISHVSGRDSQPKLSVLQPMSEASLRPHDLREAAMLSRGKLAGFFPNGGFLDPEAEMLIRGYNPNVFALQGTSQMKSSYYEQQTCTLFPKEEPSLGYIERSSTPSGIKNMSKENCVRPSPPMPSVISDGDQTPSGYQLQGTQATQETFSALRLRSSPTAATSTQRSSSSPSSSVSDTFLHSSPSMPSLLVSSMPSLVMSSTNASNIHSQLNMSTATSSSLQSMGLQMPHFLCACDEHPQGKAHGVECPKCDMVLSSSQSLGGHMTMTHSRNSCKTLKCPKCNWHYKYQETLEIHMKEKHLDTDAQCVYCLTNQAHPRLARGESYSCGYKPYRCEVCNYSTTTKGNLSIHMQSDKHINNMQDLANGSAELKIQPQQPPSTASLPPSASAPLQNSPASYQQEDCQLKKIKQKQSFRCDVCSYETSVARNLRIHMTSEKHTHNMLVMTQSINHLHQDITLHQMSQMNQLLAINQQEQAARYAAISSHLPNPLFPYEHSSMLMPSVSSQSPSGFEIPMNLSKENGIDECEGPVLKKDATKMFQCCICYKYCSDSIENVQNHIQYDRTKSVNSDTYVTFSSGTYHCNLCSYKTHLKANFQLHCKTDKHLQKLQLVNHIMEGGSENEWRLSHSGSSMQICCNACSFYANSIYKMQLHLSTIQHESCAQLFRHLQLLDRATPAPGPGKIRYYQCSLCASTVRTKQKLILHSKAPHHIRKEQSLPQGQVSIFDVYLLKEMTEGDTISFEDEDDVNSACSPDGSDDLRDLTSSNNNYTKAPPASLPPPAHGVSSATSCSDSISSSATDYSLLKAGDAEKLVHVDQEAEKNGVHSGSLGVTRSSASSSKSSGSPSRADISTNSTNISSSSVKYDKSDSDITATFLDCRVNITLSTPSKLTSLSSPVKPESKKGAAACILCPLCRHECADSSLLESHLVKEHNVASEGLQRLMSMVDMPASMASAENFASSLPTQPGDNTTATTACPTPLSTEAVPSTNPASEAGLPRRPSKQSGSQNEAFIDNNSDQNGDDQLAAAIPKPVSSTGQHNMDMQSSSNPASSPPCSTTSLTPFAAHVISSPAFVSSSSNQNPLSDNRMALILSQKDEDKEINLQNLEEEYTNLLALEGVDLAAQEKLDKEFEELFRCQTCSKSFSNIDQLYSHQNELGHLELKQTPRGPGYLCWKKGCNQYFRTASTLQVHFREIHTKKSSVGILSPQELEPYKFKCGQCSFSFKALEVMQKHTLFHLMQSVTQCRMCSKQMSSVGKMRRHLEIEHGDMSLADMTEQMERIEVNAGLLFGSPVFEQFTSKLVQASGNLPSRNGISNTEKVIPSQVNLVNGLDMKDNVEREDEYMDESDGGLEQIYNDKQFLEDYMNSQSMAEEHYKSGDRKFKCHRCRMGFTNQRYLFAHNKTSVHRRNEFPDSFDDLARPYRCEVCKESFTQKSILLVHYNSVSHLHKMKQQSQMNGDTCVASSVPQLTPPLSSSPKVNSPSITSLTNGSYNTLSDSTPGTSISIKPYKCNICKVSYNNQPSIEIHLRSVGHKTKASKLGELIQTGQVDVHQALIEHPDPRTAGKQQAQIIADMIHQQATAQAASSAAASYFNIQGINAMTQLSLLGIIPPAPSYMMPSQQNALAAMSNAQLEAYYSSLTSQFSKEGSRSDSNKLQSSREFAKEKTTKTSSHSESDKIVNMIIKQDGKIEPAGSGNRSASGAADTRSSVDSKPARKEDDLPPNFHAPIIARPRGFMGRFKPQLHRSLLENFGFECVMHFNEENIGKHKEISSKEEDVGDEDEHTGEKKDNESPDKDIKMEVDDNNEENKDKENVPKADEPKDDDSDIKDERKEENKENIDLPELNKCKCTVCHKDFSNVWVLKNHEEEVHNNFVSPEVIEDFGQKFREGWEKHLPKPVEHETGLFPQPSPTSPTPSNAVLAVERSTPSEMPPPPPPSQMSANYDMSQLLPLMSMNLLPMHLSMNLVNLGLQSSLMPSLMMPPMDLGSSFLSQMNQQSLADSSGSVSSQQQLQAAAAAAAVAAQNQKRVRTRISDDQLKVLRQYFDINNSPSEEQINKMSDQTGLPQKVIKHWFRNTLFKERQRNKDSPYNFNNPPSTSIDLDEYDRTGKIPEVKIEPEENDEGDTSMVVDVKKEMLVPAEENVDDKIFEQDTEILDNIPLKIDLTASTEHFDERRKDQESHSSSSSPSMSSIPSTPTASGPTTPTPMISTNPINTANPLTFSLDAYAANMARLEAATFQSMGKRANRTRFTDFQIKTLQDYFERNAYPKDDELEHLSKMLGLSARVIVVWFQNARQKARKIYENQPGADTVKDSVSPFQRTPGQNYQCKKCNSVFQRYYELIKHQKSSCVGESNNNKPIPSLTEDDSNFSYSNDDSIISERQSTPLSGSKDRDLQPRSQPLELLSQSRFQPQEYPSRPQPQDLLSPTSSTITTKLSSATVAPIPSISSSSSSSSSSATAAAAAASSSTIPFFKCDKCNLTFSRFDMWQEHQKAHSIAPAMYTPFSSSSAFGMLQTLAHHEDSKATLPIPTVSTPSSLLPSAATMHVSPPSSQHSAMIMTQAPMSTSPSPSSKRKTDSEDESGEQPRDKRLRTTILPEQLDYLYQQYQIDCNPSRKQLEHIANTVNLKKRVVQVWFQNTRARERKGHYRAHQQLINKRCPFCRALFRAKSALESHLATKHPEEMAKGDINIDLIPDAIIEPPVSHVHSSLPTSLGHGMSSTHTSTDISKLLPHGAASTMPNYMAFLSSAGGLNLPFPGPAPEMLGHPSFEDPFFKKYMSDLASSMVARQELSGPSSHSHLSGPPNISAHSTHKPQTNPSASSFISTTRPLDAHKPRSTSQPPPAVPPSEDAPLDLSKPVKPPTSDTTNEVPQRSSFFSNLDFNDRPMEMDYLRRLSSMDDSFSETQSEMADHEYMNDIGSSPPSPSRSINGPHHSGNTPCGSGKRYRTQMSAVQVKVMKHLFQDYKTPTMAECELLGQEIGLAKRVVQVWFQNARAKEKKAKLNSGKLFNAEVDFPKSPEDCKLCNYKYTHKVTVQDHIFTKAHIDRVKTFLNAQGDRDPEVSSSSLSSLPRSQGDSERVHKMWDESSSHIAQLQAMGISPSTIGYTLNAGESSAKNQDKESQRKESKSDALNTKDEQQQAHAAMEMSMNAQMLSALGGYMPGLDPAYLSYMYGGLPGYFPGMGLSMMQSGLIPEHMLAYDPLVFGTPLTLLQIPGAAIKSVSDKLSEAGAVLARYTQDCQALADLHNIVSAADLTVAAEATLDVGYICKKCQMVYPARESCIAHQRSVCMASSSSLPKGFEPIMKLEQVQYECRACNERFSTIMEFKIHCQQEAHKQRLMKFKAREAARREAAGSPSSSAPYTSSTSKVISPSLSHVANPLTPSPLNNNSSNHNNNQATAPNRTGCSKPASTPSSAHQYNKMLPGNSVPSVFKEKHSPVFTEVNDLKRLKAE